MLSHLPADQVPPVPGMKPAATIGSLPLGEWCPLAEVAGEDGMARKMTAEGAWPSMEDLGQTTGFLRYRAEVEGPIDGTLDLHGVKDRIHVLVDGSLTGVGGRMASERTMRLRIPGGSRRLELWVENMGRVNYGAAMNGERKGLDGPVTVGGRRLAEFELTGWSMRRPPQAPYRPRAEEVPEAAPMLYRGRVTVENARDTWLDLRGFGRGIVWWNGRNLGRYWSAGPVQGIYLPACWIKTDAENEVVLLELEQAKTPTAVPTRAGAVWAY